jgi:pilus assembly protein Flp/PilA
MLHRAKSAAIRLWKDENGASLLEYSLLIGIISAITAALILGVGGWVSGRWTDLQTALGIPKTP